MSQGTRCQQLAMYVVFESPLQMLADSPSNYRSEPESLAFLSAVPTVWDETRVLSGEVGEHILVARRQRHGLVRRRADELGRARPRRGRCRSWAIGRVRGGHLPRRPERRPRRRGLRAREAAGVERRPPHDPPGAGAASSRGSPEVARRSACEFGLAVSRRSRRQAQAESREP